MPKLPAKLSVQAERELKLRLWRIGERLRQQREQKNRPAPASVPYPEKETTCD